MSENSGFFIDECSEASIGDFDTSSATSSPETSISSSSSSIHSSSVPIEIEKTTNVSMKKSNYKAYKIFGMTTFLQKNKIFEIITFFQVYDAVLLSEDDDDSDRTIIPPKKPNKRRRLSTTSTEEGSEKVIFKISN